MNQEIESAANRKVQEFFARCGTHNNEELPVEALPSLLAEMLREAGINMNGQAIHNALSSMSQKIITKSQAIDLFRRILMVEQEESQVRDHSGQKKNRRRNGQRGLL